MKKFRDGNKAIAMLDKLLKDKKETSANINDTYAAALAETGKFDKAIAKQKVAVKNANSKDKPAYEKRLTFYQDKKPFRSKSGKPQRKRSTRR